MLIVPQAATAGLCVDPQGEFVVSAIDGWAQRYSRIWGDIVVWRKASGVGQIWANDLSTGELIQITSGPGANYVNIHEDTTVWDPVDNSGIWAYDLQTRTTEHVFDHGSNPDIYGDIVVWERAKRIEGMNLATGADIYVTEVFEPGGGPGRPRIFGDIVVWEQSGDLLAYNLATGYYFPVSSESAVGLSFA